MHITKGIHVLPVCPSSTQPCTLDTVKTEIRQHPFPVVTNFATCLYVSVVQVTEKFLRGKLIVHEYFVPISSFPN
jgi:hypothetical protein